MAGLSVTERSSGLFVAEQAAVPRQIRDELKRIDPRFVLACEVDERHQCFVWRLLVRQGDRPAVWAFDWRENMEDPTSRPRPLSMGILEEIASRKLDSRRPQIDPLEHNDRVRMQNREEMRQASEDAARWAKRKPLSPPKPSVALRMAKDKQRRRGENV